MSHFYPLTITNIQAETRDAVVITLQPQEKDRSKFDFIQGQYLTFRHQFEGVELRRCYSICAGKNDGCLQIGIKHVKGGAFSSWANESLKIGDIIEAMPPMGNFHTPIKAEQEKHYLGIAAGSGITPIISIIKTLLAYEAKSRFTLVYGNRQISSIMFRDQLEDIKNNHLSRFSLLHILGRESQELDVFSGRIDAEKCTKLFDNWIDIKTVDTAFICGPEAMMHIVSDALGEHGLTKDQIKFELFATAQPGRIQPKRQDHGNIDEQGSCEVRLTLDGVTRNFTMPKQGQSLLDASLENHIDVPYSCKAGICSTCRTKVLEGDIEMMNNHALEDYEVKRGYRLSCQSYPLTNHLVVSYDE